jgi:Protein of unknown function (DUF1549)/Protein of unknown function (DUF1553)
MIQPFVISCLMFAALSFTLRAQEATQPIPSQTTSNVSVDPWQSIPLGLDPTSVIDLALEDGWRINQIAPVAPADDPTFLRRIYLDLVGRIPKSDEANAFLARTDSMKRVALIDSLLESEEHSDHFAEVLDAILIGRTDIDQLRRRTNAGWIAYLKRAIHDNRPWNEVAQEILLARSSSPQDRGANWYLYARNNKPQDIAEAVSKDFFGVRIDCAQCHDHPLASEIEQRHYWGLVAFFNRSKNVDTPQGPGLSEAAIGGFSEFSNLEGQSLPNELVYLGNRRVEETRPNKETKEEERDDLYIASSEPASRVPKFSRRERFVEDVLKDHPLLSKGTVNRLWAWMLGRGLVHPVDALDSYHTPSHPGLLDWLSRDFAKSGYNMRRLLRSLALTRAYQLASTEEKFTDPQWFSSSISKPLTAEMLQRSMLVAMAPENPENWNKLEHRTSFAKLFPDVLAEESISNVSQGLLLTNGQSINELVSVKHSGFLKALQSLQTVENDTSEVDSTLVTQLFAGILGRKPDAQELEHCLAYMSRRVERRDQAIEGIAWSIITSAEFRFNH